MRSDATPADAARILGRVGAPWWIAGGWALDLHLGRETRAHEDLDVAMLRRDEAAFRDALAGWDLHAGRGEGVIDASPLAGPLPLDRPALWCRPRPDAPWAFELLPSDAEGDAWVFKRDARVRRPLATLGVRTADGIPYLAPEVVLLHKAKARRAVDEADLAAVAPTLDAAARAWLVAGLDLAHTGHAWAERLRRSAWT